MNHNQLFLGVGILCIIIFLAHYLLSLNIENFQTSTNPKCPDSNWWDSQPVRTIISKQSGVHFPVIPIDESLAINSPILIPINQKGTTKATSCLYVNDDGTYSIAMCDSEISRHQWIVKVIQNQNDFKTILANKPIQPGDLDNGSNVDYSTREFNFCLIVSKHIPYKVLHYENNSLAVRDVGYFTGQQWYISPKKTQASIAIKPISQHSLFTPELNTNPQIGTNTNPQFGTNTYNPVNFNSNPILPYLNNGNAIINPVVSETAFGGNGSSSGNGLNFKITIDSNNELVKELLSGTKTDNETKKETEQSNLESFEDKPKCKCNGCKPFNLAGYIKNKKIPCNGCNLEN
jgi:hypothetical protein